MYKDLIKLQTGILFIGTLFAWFTVYTDFARFYNLYGSLTKIEGCTIPNPITTPCFYGAFAFLLGFILSFKIYHKIENNKEYQNLQKRLGYLLIAGTIFAWGNFSRELIKFYTAAQGTQVSCSGVPTNNVLLTPCFIGACIFLTALITSLIIAHTAKSKN